MSQAQQDESELAPEQVQGNNLINHVAVKPPPFDEQVVSKWFKILDSNFVNSRITKSETKFHNTLTHLPLNVVSQISDEVIDSVDYDRLKNAVMTRFSKSTPELFESLISKNRICFTKPTVFLNEIRKIAEPLNVNEDFLKIKFLKCLPDHIRPIIVSKDNLSLQEMAQAADCIMEYETGQNYANNNFADSCNTRKMPSVNYVGENSRHSSSNFEPVRRNCERDHRNFVPERRQPPNFSVEAIPMGIRSFHASQRPQVCRSHLYFGQRAKNCKPWCIMSDSRLPMQPNSRANSPAREPRHSGNSWGNSK